MKNIYTSGQYIRNNPSYHAEDSEFKCNNFVNILKKNHFNFEKINSITDIGCGVGAIIQELNKKKLFKKDTKFTGFDINPDAINLAKKNNETNIDFYCENYFHSSSYKKTDLIICADVYEHIEDYIGFLKKLVTGGEFFLFNIPLDVCLRSLLDNRVFSENYKNAGHLHFYNKHVAKLILNHCNYEIIDTIYAKSFLTHVKIDSIKKMIYYIPMKFFDLINEDLSASLFGHYSLVVLAKRSKENNIK